MKIKIEGLFNKERITTVEGLVNESIFDEDFSGVGRLVEELAKKKLLSAQEVFFIAKGYDGTAEFVKE